MPSQYALVKWLSGDDTNKFTPGVPIEWLRDFDYDEFLSGGVDDDVSYLCEWREGKKEPPGGWPLYDAKVIEVSTSLALLERKMVLLELEKSPKVPPVPVRASPRKHQPTQPTAPARSLFKEKAKVVLSRSGNPKAPGSSGNPKAPGSSGNPKASSSGNPKASSSGNPKAPSSGNPKTPGSSGNPKTPGSSGNPKTPSSRGNPKTPSSSGNPKALSSTGSTKASSSTTTKSQESSQLTSSISGVEILTQSDSTDSSTAAALEGIRAELNGLKKEIADLIKFMKSQQASERNHGVNVIDGLEVQEKGENYFITFKGKELLVPCTSYESALKAPTASSMTSLLLVGAFPLEVLLRSTLKGGKTKVGAKKGQATDQLDPAAMHVMKAVVQSKFPNTTDVAFGVAVNAKLAVLKAKTNKAEEKSAEKSASACKQPVTSDTDESSIGDEEGENEDQDQEDEEDEEDEEEGKVGEEDEDKEENGEKEVDQN